MTVVRIATLYIPKLKMTFMPDTTENCILRREISMSNFTGVAADWQKTPEAQKLMIEGKGHQLDRKLSLE
jgi:hypothetical protein